MMRLLFLALLFLYPSSVYACDPPSLNVNDCDPFRLTSSDHALHVVGAFATTIITQHIVRKLGMTKTEAILFSAGINYLAWTLKEFEHDEFASSGNNRGNMLGIGFATIFAIPFLP